MTETYTIGDVIEDAYGNPAVVVRVNPDTDPLAPGQPSLIMQTVGSDYGNVTYAPRNTRTVPDRIRRVIGERAEATRERAREAWRANPGRYAYLLRHQ